MCGINGIVNFESRDVSESDLHKMNNQMIHRGPDGDGIFLQGSVGLAMRRLAIIDLSGGDQPIFNEDKSVVVVMNGEIYNYIELREDLIKKGHHFSTKSDTETLVHLYEEYGSDFIKYLNGMFSFALHDIKNEKTIIARDRLGIKPFYFKACSKSLIFSSSLDSLTSILNEKPKINEEGLLRYLSMSYIVHPETIYQRIEQLAPGHYLEISRGDVTKVCYWKLEVKTDLNIKTNNEYKEIIRSELKKSVALRMRSDVPVGSFLSGGIDSSSIVALMSEHAPDTRFSFSVGFSGGEDELSLARIVANKYRTHHIEKLITVDDVIECLPELIEKLDTPHFDSAIIPSFILSKYARERGVKVILNGTGGDEVFGGYHRHHITSFSKKLINHMPSPIRTVMGGVLGQIDPQKGQYLKSKANAFFAQIASLDWRNFQLIYKGDIKKVSKIIASDYEKYSSDCDKKHMKLDLSHYLPGNILSLLDKTTMAVSIEGRTPFLDHNLVEAAYKIPKNVLIQEGQLKYLLRESMRDSLPKELYAQKKTGFGGPIHFWMKEKLLKISLDALVSRPSSVIKNYFNIHPIQNIQPEQLTPSLSQFIFSLYILNEWCLMHVDDRSYQ